MTTMSVGLYLQRLGLDIVRPRQASRFDYKHLHLQKIPIQYPTQDVDMTYTSRTEPGIQGEAAVWPWPIQEIERNSGTW